MGVGDCFCGPHKLTLLQEIFKKNFKQFFFPFYEFQSLFCNIFLLERGFENIHKQQDFAPI